MFNTLLLKLFSQVVTTDDIAEAHNNGIEHRITGISVSGLKRTKLRVIERPLQKFIGTDERDININDVYAIIEDTGILEPVSIEITDNQEEAGKTLAITVREKWSIIPSPYFGFDSDNWVVGGAVFDSNAFGLRDAMLVMGTYGKNSWSAMFMYISTPNTVGDFGFSVGAHVLSQNTEHTEQTGKEVLRRFNTRTISPSFALMYSLTELLTPRIGISYRNSVLRDTEDPVNAPDDGMQAIIITPGIGMRHTSWDGYLLGVKSATLRYHYSIVFGGNNVQSLSLDSVFNHSIVPGFRFTAKSGLQFTFFADEPYFESSPVSAVNILASTYSAAHYAGLSLGLEKYLFRFKYGTFALAAAYQNVFSRGNLLGNQFDHGPATTLKMYFSRIAVPGIEIGIAYNAARDKYRFAFNMSGSF